MITLLLAALLQDDPVKEYEKGLPLFEAAEATRDPEKCEEVIAYFTDYLWKFEPYLIAYDAMILLGRAHQFLAEQGVKSAENWARALANVGRGKALLGEADDVAFRSAGQEIRMRVAYGDRLRGASGLRQYEAAAKIAEPMFKKAPKMRDTELGKAVELETARAMCKAGQTKKGFETLNRLRNANRKTWIEERALDLLGEFAAATDPKVAIECADFLHERGEFHRALVHYRRARSSMGVAQCYLGLHRYHEALAALPREAVAERLQALRRLSWIDKDMAAEYLKLAATAPDDVRRDIDDWIVGENLESDGKFAEAAAQFAKIGPASKLHDKAAFRSGLDWYRAGAHEKALATFEAHLAWKDATPEFRARSAYYASRCCLKLGRPERVLDLAKGAEPRVVSARVEALLALARVDDAEAEVRDLRKAYDRSGLGRDDLQISIARLVTALEKKGLEARALEWTWVHYRIDDSDWSVDQRITFADRLAAAKLPDRAREVYERVLIERDTEILRRKFVRACSLSGRPDTAIAYLEELLAADAMETSKNGSAWEELADAYFAKAESLRPGGERIAFLKKAEKIYGTFAGRLKHGGSSENFYRLSLRIAACLSHLDPDGLADWFKQMDSRGYGAPDWGGSAHKEAFETLRKDLESRLPKKR